MRILLVSPRTAQYASGNELAKTRDWLPNFQPQAQWASALTQLGNQVKIFCYDSHSFYHPTRFDRKLKLISPEVIATNLRLISSAHTFQPDLVLISAGSWMINPSTVAKLQSRSKVILLSGVSPISFNQSVEAKYLPHIDLVCTNDPLHQKQWHQLGARKTLTLPISAIDPDYYFQKKQSSRPTDVAIVASLFPQRQQQLCQLIQSLPATIKLDIYGWLPPQVNLYSQLKKNYHGAVWGKQLIKVYQNAKIGLNTTPDHMSVCGNIRTFEIAAAGALLLTDKLHSKWFTDWHNAIEYSNIQALGKLIPKILSNAPLLEEIAYNGKRYTLSHHTYYHRFKKLLTLIY